MVQNILFALLVSTSVAVPFLIAKHVPSDGMASETLHFCHTQQLVCRLSGVLGFTCPVCGSSLTASSSANHA